jgi:hypothetical protein
MHRMRIAFFAAIFWLPLGLAGTALAAGQKPSPPTEAKPASQAAGESEAQLRELVRATVAREFGPHFTVSAKFPPMFGDFDGDGVEDLAVVVTGNPALDQAAHNYKLIDPYDSFFGFGDPKIMMSFSVHTPEQARYVAIVHQWRSAHPKAKFVIINLPFEQIEVSSARLKKKLVSALFATDSTGLHAQVFWDGHKYRWVALGTD